MLTSSNSWGNTKMISVRVPRRVRERVEAVAPQLYEQDKLSEELGQHFSTLREASSAASPLSPFSLLPRKPDEIDDAFRAEIAEISDAYAYGAPGAGTNS